MTIQGKHAKDHQIEALRQQLQQEMERRKSLEQQLRFAEIELQQLTQQLYEAGQHKNEFLSSMSHELRTPLNAMIGYTSLTLNTLKGQIKPELLENLTKAEQSARLLSQLITDVLAFSKIESGEIETVFEEIDLADILEDAIINTESILSHSPVELREEIAVGLPLIKSDYTKVKQILDNLFSNAIKFTAEGYIAVRAGMAGEHSIRVEIEDSGVGIPLDKIGSIFELFKQVDGSTKKKFAGTGLGLAITKSFCKMLHIDIGVESEEGRGTLFWLHIPVQEASERGTQAFTASQLSSPPSRKPSEHVQKKERGFQSILIVDDDKMNLSLHQEIFQGADYTVYLAESGIECLKKAKQYVPDVILMDLGMPEMDGFETTKRLKQNPELSHIPIIACSAFTNRELQEKARQVGCEGYITKPIEPQHLIAQVTRIVQADQSSRSQRKNKGDDLYSS